jgi:hypothetical protein
LGRTSEGRKFRPLAAPSEPSESPGQGAIHHQMQSRRGHPELSRYQAQLKKKKKLGPLQAQLGPKWDPEVGLLLKEYRKNLYIFEFTGT